MNKKAKRIIICIIAVVLAASMVLACISVTRASESVGWKKVNENWYYYSDDVALTGWQRLEWNNTTSWYYFNSDGTMATGWIKPGNYWYYLSTSGRMLTGWQWLDWNGTSSWYYFYPSGAMATGWVKSGNYWYYLSTSGRMLTGWQKINWKGIESWYYFNNSGAMLTGWQTINNKRYYFTSSGAMFNDGFAADGNSTWKVTNGYADYDYTGEYTLYEASNYGYDSSTKLQITNGKVTTFDRVFIGDSRTGCLSWAGDSNDGFICKWGMEYDYFVNTEIPELENLIQIMPNIKYVEISMGANDILHGMNLSIPEVQSIAAKYAARVNELIEKYPNIKFYYASVFYVEVSDSYTETATWANVNKCNTYIDTFNAYIKAYCNATYIPLQEYVSNNGFRTGDGLHIFDYDTLRDMRNYIASYMM